MTEGKVKCDICGELVDEWDASGMNIGRRTKYICSKCYKRGYSAAERREIEKVAKLKDLRQRKDEKR